MVEGFEALASQVLHEPQLPSYIAKSTYYLALARTANPGSSSSKCSFQRVHTPNVFTSIIVLCLLLTRYSAFLGELECHCITFRSEHTIMCTVLYIHTNFDVSYSYTYIYIYIVVLKLQAAKALKPLPKFASLATWASRLTRFHLF